MLTYIFSLSSLYLCMFFLCYLLVPTYYQPLYIAEVLYNINIEYCYIGIYFVYINIISKINSVGIILFIYLFSCALNKFQ